jgi:hypothetical protein
MRRKGWNSRRSVWLDNLDLFDRQGLTRGGKNSATFIDEAFLEIETRSGFEKITNLLVEIAASPITATI